MLMVDSPKSHSAYCLNHEPSTANYQLKMRAMLLETPRQPLRAVDIPVPKPAATQVLVKVAACAVCRTDLHVVDGELPNPKLPLVPGHEIVGVIVETGKASNDSKSATVWAFPG